MFKLVIQDDEGKTTVVPLIRDEITVGRKEGNTIRLTERNVSRHHARIMRANGSIAIEDLDSYNGVRVNGSRIKGRQPLTLSDRIQIGDYLIEIKADGAETPPSVADDQLTQPIEKPERAASSSTSIPVVQAVGGPNAETIKLPSQLVPPAAAKSEHGGGNGVSAAAALTPAPLLEPKTPAPEVSEQPEDETPPARLVVLSSNFAGVEYELSESTMVLGRTDDNDVVINHRSISRNHAKIVQEDGRFSIVDLQSSNGVRVNNEEYEKVELRRGDVIDLGHVRLRFADPGDDYTFKPEDASDVSTGSSKGVWYALLAVLVVLVGVGVFALLSDGPSGGSGSTDPEGGAEGTQANPGAQTPKHDFDGLMAQAEAAIENRDWPLAEAKGTEALAMVPGDKVAQQRAQQVIDRAVDEKSFQVQFEALRTAAAAKDYEQVKTAFAAIGDKSTYRTEARDEHDRVRDAYIAEVKAEAQKLTGQCQPLRKLQAKATEVWPEAGQAVGELADACRRPGTAPVPTPRVPTPPPDQPEPDPGTEPSNPPERSDKSVPELLDEAQDAALKGQYGRARKLCEEALDKQPRDGRAVTICATAACGLQNARLAKRYYDQSSGEERKLIQKFCSGKGIELRPGAP